VRWRMLLSGWMVQPSTSTSGDRVFRLGAQERCEIVEDLVTGGEVSS
jgi:hypothetical protein